MPWARKHGLEFAPAKYQLNHLTDKHPNKVDLNANVILPGPDQPIKARTKVKYLGLTLYTNLTWRPHIEGIKSKVTKSVGALFKISGST